MANKVVHSCCFLYYTRWSLKSCEKPRYFKVSFFKEFLSYLLNYLILSLAKTLSLSYVIPAA